MVGLELKTFHSCMSMYFKNPRKALVICKLKKKGMTHQIINVFMHSFSLKCHAHKNCGAQNPLLEYIYFMALIFTIANQGIIHVKPTKMC